MVNNFNLARPYVKAVFALALQQGKLQEWENLLHLLSWIISQGSAMNVWQNPQIGDAQKIEFLYSFCKVTEEPMQTEVNNLLKLLVHKKKLFVVPQIEILFKQSRNVYENVMTANVISAFPLDEDQLHKIEIALAEKFKNKIILSSSVDLELIGGAVIYLKDYVIDGSIKGQLTKLSEYLI